IYKKQKKIYIYVKMHIKTLFIDAIIGLLDDCYIFLWFLSNKYLLNTKCTRKEDILSDVFFSQAVEKVFSTACFCV
ncbi:hypothetical protein P9008_20890, partial [Bacillus cereus]|nr:hypothetical protein [Bacillus cereus]